MTDQLWLLWWGKLANTFVKMNKTSLLFQGKEPTVFVTNDQVHVFKHEREFWKTCSCYHKLDSDKAEILADSSSGCRCGMNKWDFWCCVINQMAQHLEELRSGRTRTIQTIHPSCYSIIVVPFFSCIFFSTLIFFFLLDARLLLRPGLWILPESRMEVLTYNISERNCIWRSVFSD